ncbi:hypothetical protein FEE95_11495 [Maribacter algarum]|uniref:MG2 domain-containing protein n=1 Tax=Maribacter algarum (ex Zhang et al. 2020) TaxID=2578118 RepID=A0A5S3PVU7_9FLAO|nr:hypothetical protein [Maribacter algarum]TMM57108.1 hypothetical protein FEE95_11495 [Maribacter algarum]
MKTNIKFLVLIALVFGQISFGQDKQNSSYDQFKVLPSEKVYLSINTSLLFTGEYLFYKMYCLNDKTKQPSEISTIGYVELIGEDKEVVFRHKIRLAKSQGRGDFFVPTSVASGNYKLIAYTRWMRNGTVDVFFQEDISIINPYQVNQDAILPDLTEKEAIGAAASPIEILEDKRFVLSTDKESYAKKSKVTIGLQNFRGASGYGNYTVSVRKKEALKNTNKHTPESYIEWHKKQMATTEVFYPEIKFAPELDGELIKGQLIPKDGIASVANKKISASIPGEDFQLKVFYTDSLGVFHVNLDKDYTVPTVLFQMLEGKEDAYTIQVTPEEPIDYASLKFQKFYINPEMQDAIVGRSVHNQIENGYFVVKPDTLRLDLLNDPYGGAFVETVNLEEFTRFKTLDETIVELIPNVWTKRNKEGKKVFKVRSFDETYEESEYDALVYIDGVFIKDPDTVLDFDTRTVKSVNTVREKYRIGGKYYFGMVNIVTNEGSYFDALNDANITKWELDSPRPIKNYFNQKHLVDSNERIPDLRGQLFWKPTISFEGKELDLSFYTSEVPGEYEVVLEGFSIYGRPVAIRESFLVE